MSKLNVDQQTIFQLFSDKKSDFLIPDYQRPYAWEETECQTLWDDIFEFAFPENDYEKFNDDNDEYFLGPIVTFKNDDGKLEIIDGQQRLTTLMLLLRAFYSRFINMSDANSVGARDNMAKCIWKTDAFGNLKKDELKIESEVSTDDDKEEFLTILKTGVVDKSYKSRYANVFRYFEGKINEFINEYPSYTPWLPARIMNNCILLPIEAESQDTALRIFSTLNDRGKPLSDSDIFKAQFYKYYSGIGQKDSFISRWKELEEKCEKHFSPNRGTPLDDLFTRYMYFVRAKQGIKETTTAALRKFYEKNGYWILKQADTLSDLEQLASFWESVDNRDRDAFSDRVIRCLTVLEAAPNSMWEYFTSVYYMTYKDEEGLLEDDQFYDFLNKSIAFIFAYAFMYPGVNALRTPIYPEMIKVVNKQPVNFNEYRFDRDAVLNVMKTYTFGNGRPITRSLITWWALNNEKQQLFGADEKMEIEHIFAKKRQELEKTLQDKNSLESLGNKALLEKRVNIRAADYRFVDKKKYYNGFVTDKGVTKRGTNNIELLELAENKNDFTEKDIIEREQLIIDSFIKYLEDNDLLQ